MVEYLINSVITPEPRFFGHPVKVSVAGVLEREGKLLLVREEDGYGLPSGRLEDYEWLAPRSGLYCELFEEIGVSIKSSPVLFGIMVHPAEHKLSVGLVYKVEDFYFDPNFALMVIPAMKEIEECCFLDRKEIAKLLSEGKIRKPKWNVPALEAWLEKKNGFIKLV